MHLAAEQNQPAACSSVSICSRISTAVTTTQTLGGRVFLCDAGAGPQQFPAAGQAENLLKPVTKLLYLSVQRHLAGFVGTICMGIQKAQHQHTAADGAAQLRPAAAHAAAETRGHGHHLHRVKPHLIREGGGNRLGAIVALLAVLIGQGTAIHCNNLLLYM